MATNMFCILFISFISFLFIVSSDQTCSDMAAKNLFKVIRNSKLGVSEPPPEWFGNRANERGNKNWTNPNWLKSRFHFSFAEYNNPANTEFGVLRVMNDDLVQPDRGFGAHPHQNVEIVTYIVEGHLTHKDSMGTEETLTRGDIQFMTAGTGVQHSEHNKNKESPLRFIQIWINTRRRGLVPNYGSAKGALEKRKNQWSHVVTDVDRPAPGGIPIQINQDANIKVTELDPGQSVSFGVDSGRQAYLLCVEGSLDASDASDGAKSYSLERHDAAEIFGSSYLFKAGSSGAHVLVVEMAFTGRGRSDI
jgi:quercetin 2,3-dioxygenase